MATLRLGLIGAGPWGKICLRAITALEPAMRVSVVASRNPATTALVACPVFSEWRDLLSSGLCDAVVVTTPPDSHAEIAVAALDRGLPVFVEKPLALRPDQARAVRDAALRTGVPVVVDHIHLFSPAFRRLRERVAETGEVVGILGRAGKPGGRGENVPVLWDWGVHDVAMCLALMGRIPDQATARLVARPTFADGRGEVVELDLGFGPVRASLRLGSLERRQRLFQVTCRQGVLTYDDGADAKLTLDGRPMAIGAELPLDVALEEFRARAWDGKPDREGLELAVAAVDVLARAEETLAR
mgnify:CR=1 FL=1